MTSTKILPPTLDGISPSKVYLPKLTPPPQTLFDFLCDKFPHIAPDVWRERFLLGKILDNNNHTLGLCHPYQHGHTIYYYRQLTDEIPVPFEHDIVFENDEFLVVDKPHFLATVPTGRHVQQSLLTRLKHQTANAELSPIHRLDKDTAGLILFSKNPATRHVYQGLFATNAISKTYHAIAGFDPTLSLPMTLDLRLERGDPFYTMRVADGTPNSQTLIKLLQVSHDRAKYELTPTTGKLHQLRVHMYHLGIPIWHDPYYPTVRHRPDGNFDHPLQLLAYRLEFTDPVSGNIMTFTSKRQLIF